MSQLVIVGAGGFARETAAAVHAINAARPGTFTLLGLLDDDPALHGTTRAGALVLGGLDLLAELPRAQVVFCIVSPRRFALREQLVTRSGLSPDRLATVIHPSADVAPDAVIGPGSVLLAQVAVTAAASIGSHVLVMPQVVITHDAVIGEYATLTSGVRLGGGVHIERGAYLGAGCLVREGTRIGAGSLVGMGSVVLDDVPPQQVWVGNPARYLRDAG